MRVDDRVKAAAECIAYDAETGVFTWRVARSNFQKAGQLAGVVGPCGYRRIMFQGLNIMAHRLAFFIVYGELPRFIDHINGDRADNRIANLRPCNQSQNIANAKLKKSNKSGFKGVFWDAARGKWHAQIKIDRKSISLGRFASPEAAHAAYLSAAKAAFGEFARAS